MLIRHNRQLPALCSSERQTKRQSAQASTSNAASSCSMWVYYWHLPTSPMSATHFLDQLISLISSLPSTTCPRLSSQSINHYGYKTVLFCPCSVTRPGCHHHHHRPTPWWHHTHRKWGKGAWRLQTAHWLWTHKYLHVHAPKSRNVSAGE